MNKNKKNENAPPQLIIKLKERKFYILLFLILVISLVSTILSEYLDGDLYFILTEGRNIITEGFPQYNTAFVLDGYEIVIQQWLWDVIVYGFYMVGGYAGAAVLTVLSAGLMAVLLYLLAGRFHMDTTLRIILVFFTVFFLKSYITPRPYCITYSLLLAELLFLEQYKDTGKKKWLTALPVITLLMMNLHGALWPLCFLFALPYIFPVFRNFLARMPKREYNPIPILICYIPMALTLFLNPYGLDGILYLFRAYGDKLTSIGIAELSNVAMTSSYGGVMIAALVLYGVIFIGKKKEIPAEYAYLFAGTIIMGCMYYRNAGYGILGTFVLLCCAVKDVNLEQFHQYANKQNIAVLAVAAVGVLVSLGNAIMTGIAVQPWDCETTPLEAIAWLDENTEEGAAVYTSFNSGAYLEWCGYKIYMDARPELYFKEINGQEDIISEFMEIETCLTLESYENFKERYGFQYYLAYDGSLIGCYLEMDESFEPVVDGEGYVLYASASTE